MSRLTRTYSYSGQWLISAAARDIRSAITSSLSVPRLLSRRLGRVVADTDMVTSLSASSNILAMVDLPAPEGDESTIRSPRRWRVGWSMAALASGEPCPSSDRMVQRTKKVLKCCGAIHIVHCNKFGGHE